MAAALGAALACHAALVCAIVFGFTRREAIDAPPTPLAASDVGRSHDGVVWIARSGTGGGGGGGDRTGDSRRAKAPGADALTVPVATPASLDPSPRPIDAPLPAQPLVIDALPLASALETMPGTLEAPVRPADLSRGPGDGAGAGDLNGSGAGDGRGRGLDRGFERGSGGGQPYLVGGGVTAPTAIWIERPRYTAGAMSAHIEGSVLVECVVDLGGRCNGARVVRSLDSRFGLDEEAVRATAGWRFSPGTRLGQSVPVLVRIELAFTIR